MSCPFERRKLGLHGGAQNRIRASRAHRVHATVQRRPRIADDAAVDLRPKLLRAEQHEAEIPAAFREVEQHFADVGFLSIVRCIFVELVDKDDDVVDAEVALFQVLPEPRDDPREDQILRGIFQGGDVDNVHRAILKAPKGEVADGSLVRDQAGAAGRDIRQAISDLSDGRDVVRPPALVALVFHRRQQVAEPLFQIGERPHEVLLVAKHHIAERPVDDPLANEVDQCVGLGVDVVLVE